MARDRQQAAQRVPKIGDWLTLWYPEVNGLRAMPAQVLGRSALGGYDVAFYKAGGAHVIARLATRCPISDTPRERCLTWDAPAADAAYVPDTADMPEAIKSVG